MGQENSKVAGGAAPAGSSGRSLSQGNVAQREMGEVGHAGSGGEAQNSPATPPRKSVGYTSYSMSKEV